MKKTAVMMTSILSHAAGTIPCTGYMRFKISGKVAVMDMTGIFRMNQDQAAKAWFTKDLIQLFTQSGYFKIAL